MEEITRAERACMAGGWRLASSTEKRRECERRGVPRRSTDSEVLTRSGSRTNMPFQRTSGFRFLDQTKQENDL
uniref:Uncharacterized protein n=1 Tax=Triticum urartu TaxID=4572 RepID=A0A8R7K203_TRIUA